jgi:heme iron utilization protein
VNAEESRLLAELLTKPKTLSLGVVVDGAPSLGLVPFARAEHEATLYVHVSRLARHSAGLGQGAPIAVLLHRPEADSEDPLQLPRLTLSGLAEPLPRGSPEYVQARATYVGRFPGMSPTFDLGDFTLVALRLQGGRLVSGFAHARDVKEGDLKPAFG